MLSVFSSFFYEASFAFKQLGAKPTVLMLFLMNLKLTTLFICRCYVDISQIVYTQRSFKHISIQSTFSLLSTFFQNFKLKKSNFDTTHKILFVWHFRYKIDNVEIFCRVHSYEFQMYSKLLNIGIRLILSDTIHLLVS